MKAVQIAEHEYDLYLQNDINTRGNTQWFYFAVEAREGRQHWAHYVHPLWVPHQLRTPLPRCPGRLRLAAHSPASLPWAPQAGQHSPASLPWAPKAGQHSPASLPWAPKAG